MAIVTPTDRPKSVRNRSVIELFVALFVLSFCPFDISVSVGAFVTGLSQMSSFFLQKSACALIYDISTFPPTRKSQNVEQILIHWNAIVSKRLKGSVSKKENSHRNCLTFP